MLTIRKNIEHIELFRKVAQQIMGIEKPYNRITIHLWKKLCVAIIHNMVQGKVDNNNRQDHKNQYLFHKTGLLFFVLFSVFFALPSMAGARESRQMASPGKIAQHIVLCRTGRLTDIVVPEKILDVAMSNSSDFKLSSIRYKSRTHLVIKPLKEQSSSDLIIFGVNRVHYLRVKTVLKGQLYPIRVEIGAQILDSPQ